MADEDGGSDAGPEAPKKKAAREKLIVGGTLALVVLTVILLRRSQNASSAPLPGAAYPPGYGNPGGYTGGYAPPTNGAGYPVGTLDPTTEALLTQMEGQLAAMAPSTGGPTVPANPTPGPGTGPTSAAPGVPSAASSLGFTNPNTPVEMLQGSLIDTFTGRAAYYGPGGQPGSASPFPGAAQWIEPGGAQVYYNPTSWAYAPSSGRPPDLPPPAK